MKSQPLRESVKSGTQRAVQFTELEIRLLGTRVEWRGESVSNAYGVLVLQDERDSRDPGSGGYRIR